ncbi:MAG: 16S rRNA (adenine(1518)-N(6)/adenine(1519)-N(6))-dimethyltransferase RsmA [Planctomycetota bacterium]
MEKREPEHPPSRRQILDDLRGRGFRFRRRRGQHFLFEPQLLDALVRDAGVKESERILEVGAGTGTLTRTLLARGCHVLAVEIDGDLARYLTDSIDSPRLTILPADALAGKNHLSSPVEVELSRWAAPFRLVANLPYSIATPLLMLLLEHLPRFQGAAVLVQREVAERWVAREGSPAYGPASVLLALFGEGRILRHVPRHLFTPPPRVDSAFYLWRPSGGPPGRLDGVRRLVRRLFQGRRKMLRSLLKGTLPDADPWWGIAGIDPRWRPEQVPPEGFLRLEERLREDAG